MTLYDEKRKRRQKGVASVILIRFEVVRFLTREEEGRADDLDRLRISLGAGRVCLQRQAKA